MLKVEAGNIIECRDFSSFIKEYYDRDIDLIARHAPFMGNDSFLEIDVDKEQPEDWYPDEEDIALDPADAMNKWSSDEEDYKFLANELGINEELILWDLCRRGIIPEGKYIIKIWW